MTFLLPPDIKGLTCFTKSSILDIWRDSEFVFGDNHYTKTPGIFLRKEIHVYKKLSGINEPWKRASKIIGNRFSFNNETAIKANILKYVFSFCKTLFPKVHFLIWCPNFSYKIQGLIQSLIFRNSSISLQLNCFCKLASSL